MAVKIKVERSVTYQLMAKRTNLRNVLLKFFVHVGRETGSFWDSEIHKRMSK